MDWTRYKISILLFAAVVAWGVSVSLAEFNHRVRPEVPLCALKLENHGQGVYQVDFLGERVNFALPPDMALKYGDSEKIRGYRAQAVETLEDASNGVEVYLSQSLIKINEEKEVLTARLKSCALRMKKIIPLE